MREYFEYTDFNDIQDDIIELTDKAKLISSEITDLTKKTYSLNDFPYIQDIDKIERQFLLIGENIGVPARFNYKEWLETPTSHPVKSFGWNDYQRWVLNIRFFDEYMNSLEIRYCGEGYSGDLIWL